MNYSFFIEIFYTYVFSKIIYFGHGLILQNLCWDWVVCGQFGPLQYLFRVHWPEKKKFQYYRLWAPQVNVALHQVTRINDTKVNKKNGLS